MVARKPVPQRTPDSWPPPSSNGESRDQATQGGQPGGAYGSDFAGNEASIWGSSALSPVGVEDSQVPSSGGAIANPNLSYNSAAQILPTSQPAGATPKPETNPFKRKMSLSAQSTGAGAYRGEASGSALTSVPTLPVSEFEQLTVNDTSTNPWQPAFDQRQATTTSAAPGLAPLESEEPIAIDNVWASSRPSRQASPARGLTGSPALVSLPSDGSAIWDEVPKTNGSQAPPPLITTADEDLLGDSHAWDDLGARDKGKGAAPPAVVPDRGTSGVDDWNLIDVDGQQAPLSRQSTWENFKDEDDAAVDNKAKEDKAENKPNEASSSPQAPEAPLLPPRQATEQRPLPPPRPVDKSETYQIKNITWYDALATRNPRKSPILVQNANGPCPLLALVNALTLTTPADQPNTALYEILRSREQISLGLLLDAVFEELMRRTPPDVVLPDMTELYDFLTGLHTGMNVNPRFLPTKEVVEAFKSASRTQNLNTTERADRIPGTFEHTKEMALYSTFCIPLIHGWLPSRDEPVYDAFSRHATSYEDAQNLLFREEELEEKLCDPQRGLNEEEQQIYQDVMTIKDFLSSSATQLTGFGLDVIQQAMKPGSVAILFRNDHFSTLYRHPETLGLFSLVTDAGYAGHDEVVWESLVDVTGESAEFFSGDFLVVGGALHDTAAGPSQIDGGGEWTTVQGRRNRNQRSQPNSSLTQIPEQLPPPVSPNEQEDRDLALAMQLQEEEDARARAEQERRRREARLSEEYIEQQGRANGGSRGGRNPTGVRRPSPNQPPIMNYLQSSSGSGRRGREPTPARPAAASTSNISATSTTSTRTRPGAQTVRSLLPPLPTQNGANRSTSSLASSGRRGGGGSGQDSGTTSAPTFTTHRPADLEEDDAPPSYEQAAKQKPYVPPEGHPAHPSSPPTPLVAAIPVQPGGHVRVASDGGMTPPYQQPQQPPGTGGLRPGVPPPAGAGVRQGDKDKCVVM